jgi:hypothetical protein
MRVETWYGPQYLHCRTICLTTEILNRSVVMLHCPELRLTDTLVYVRCLMKRGIDQAVGSGGAVRSGRKMGTKDVATIIALMLGPVIAAAFVVEIA